MISREELAYNEAVRAIEDQRSSIEALQVRAGILVAALAFVAPQLGVLAFAGHSTLPYPPVSLLGFMGLLVSVGGLGFVLWPQRNWGMSLRGQHVLEPHRFPGDGDAIAHDLTIVLTRRFDIHRPRIRRLWLAMRAALIGLGVNLVSWSAVALWTRG